MKKKKSDPKRYNLDVRSSSSNPSYTSANLWVTVGNPRDPTGADFYTLAAALQSGATNIHLADGLHVLDQTVVLDQTRAGLNIRGSSKEKTIVKYTGKESMFVMFNTRNVAISNLQLDAREANPPPADDTDIDPTNDESQEEQMWQVIGVVNSSGIGILDCIIHAPSTMHAVFFAGSFYASSRLYQPFFGDTSSRYEEGEKETVDAYRGGYLDENNAVRNNEIYSGFDGDALVFTFQRNGEVSGNRIVKGSISLYMNRDTACRSNTVMNAPTYGIHLTLPSDNVYIDANRIVRSGASAIRVARMDMDGGSGPMTHDIQQIIQPPPTVSTDERPPISRHGHPDYVQPHQRRPDRRHRGRDHPRHPCNRQHHLPDKAQRHMSPAHRSGHRLRQPSGRLWAGDGRPWQSRAQRWHLRSHGRHRDRHREQYGDRVAMPQEPVRDQDRRRSGEQRQRCEQEYTLRQI